MYFAGCILASLVLACSDDSFLMLFNMLFAASQHTLSLILCLFFFISLCRAFSWRSIAFVTFRKLLCTGNLSCVIEHWSYLLLSSMRLWSVPLRLIQKLHRHFVSFNVGVLWDSITDCRFEKLHLFSVSSEILVPQSLWPSTCHGDFCFLFFLHMGASYCAWCLFCSGRQHVPPDKVKEIYGGLHVAHKDMSNFYGNSRVSLSLKICFGGLSFRIDLNRPRL